MHLLPSMLLATTLLGAGGNVQADVSAMDMNALQNIAKECETNGQVIVGTPNEMKDILGELGIDIQSIVNCDRPSMPEADKPDTETPDNGGTNKPDIEKPDAAQNYVERVVELVNIERVRAGLPALAMKTGLNNAALIRAKETVQSFSHTRPNGQSFSSVLKENGITYRGAGENIAWGQRTPEIVVDGWMKSEGHRANILNKSFTSIGVGYHLNGSTPYWVQLFTY